MILKSLKSRFAAAMLIMLELRPANLSQVLCWEEIGTTPHTRLHREQGREKKTVRWEKRSSWTSLISPRYCDEVSFIWNFNWFSAFFPFFLLACLSLLFLMSFAHLLTCDDFVGDGKSLFSLRLHFFLKYKKPFIPIKYKDERLTPAVPPKLHLAT